MDIRSKVIASVTVGLITGLYFSDSILTPFGLGLHASKYPGCTLAVNCITRFCAQFAVFLLVL